MVVNLARVRKRTDSQHSSNNNMAGPAVGKRSDMKRWIERTRNLVLVALALCLAIPAYGQLTIEIIGGGATQTPISIVPFAGEVEYPLGITGVVGADLQRSGLFRLVDPGAARAASPQDVRFPEFRDRGAEALV